MVKKISLSFLVSLFLSSCGSGEKESFDLIISNASIVDVASDAIIPDQLIAISNDTIRRVDEMANFDNYDSQNQIDAKGKYVMPGLWDMHVHFRGGDTLVNENKDLLPLFLAYGVTSVRDAGGDITPSVLEWRKEIQNEKLEGPTIYTSGPKLDGADPAWPGSLKVSEPQDVERALDSLQRIGADYVKMYDGSLTEDAFYNIIQAAEKRGLKTTGHMPLSASFTKAMDYGLDGTEHMYYVLTACSPLGDSLSKAGMGYGMMGQVVNSYDPQLAEQVFARMKEKNMFITPTLHIGKTLGEILDVDHSQDSLLSSIGEGIQQTYQGRIEGAKRSRARGNNLRQEMQQLTMRMMVPMHKAGVNLIAGSDCGPFNSYVYPGGSLHGELRRMVEAGLSPQEALTTSIINGPKFFELQDFYGSIEKGKVADLLILQTDPLEDIDFANEIDAIVRQGEIYDREELHSFLKE